METPAPSRPAVVAVMVTRNPGPWFDEALAALAAQDYTNLAVLVIDAASDDDPTGRVASVLPDAYVLRLDDNPGYGAAANKVREVVDGAAFYCFFHDDVAPKPRAITTMVGEALRSNAGVVGGKLVRWDDDRRLLQVGEAADKTGERSMLVEPGELDQEQHDSVRDVFLVPGGATLVRSDLFAAIGGFDEGIDLLNEDLNLCWRAHVAGGRVIVAPDAVIRHLEVLAERSPLEERRFRIMRHRLRTMLVCYGRWHRIRVVPQAVIVAVLEVVYSLVVGRTGQARDVVAAWRWNLARRDEIRTWRARVEEFRTVPDAEIRRLQLRGSARVARFLRGQEGRGGARSDRAQETLRRLADGVRDGSLRWPIAAWAVTVAIVAFGSRHLIFGPIADVGGFLPFDRSPGDLVNAYLSGWRDVGLGAETPAPTSFGLFGAAGTLFLGAMGALRRVVLLGSLVVGLVGAFRLLRPTRSVTAQAAALVVYGAAPLAYDAIAGAQWGALTVYAVTPWVLGHLARAGRFEPFDDRRSFAGRVCGFGLLLALTAAIEPAIVVVVLAVAVGLALGTLLVGGRGGLLGLAATTGTGLVVTIVLHLPWAFEFILPGASWEMVVGAHSDPAWSIADLFRFDVGPVGSSVLLVGLPLAALLPLLIGRDWRFDWAVRAWSVAITVVLVTWASAQGWLPFAAPRAETMLMPVAMSLGVAVAMGVVAFQVDLRQYGFGWRQVAAAASGVALLLGAFPTLLDSGNGRWYLPGGGLDRAFAFVEEEEPGFRMLWVGDPDVMPVPGYPLDDDVTYATTDNGLASFTDGWPGAPPGSTQLIEDSLAIAESGETSRLGRLLAPMAIRYIVVPTASAPQPLGGTQRPPPEGILDALSAQLDLAEVAVNPEFTVYRNEAALPARAIVDPDIGGGTIFDASADELAAIRPALDDQTGRTRYEGGIEAGSRVLHSVTAADGWELRVDGRAVSETTLFGWAEGYDAETGGDAVLRYDTSPVRYLLVGVQVMFWLLVAARWFRSTRSVAPLLEDVPLIEEERA